MGAQRAVPVPYVYYILPLKGRQAKGESEESDSLGMESGVSRLGWGPHSFGPSEVKGIAVRFVRCVSV